MINKVAGAISCVLALDSSTVEADSIDNASTQIISETTSII